MLEQQPKKLPDALSATVDSSPTKNRSTVLPAGLAKAVAVSYNSNLNLLYNSQQQQRQLQERASPNDNNSSEHMLSSSMTGLEVLRNANRNHQPLTRPTSLSILQGSSGSGLMAPVPPPPVRAPGYYGVNGNNNNNHRGEHYFPPLERSNSEPSPYGANDPMRMRSSSVAAVTTATNSHVHSSLYSPFPVHPRQQQQTTRPFVPFGASALIPPRNTMAASASTATPMSMQPEQQQALYPQDACTETVPLSNGYVSYTGQLPNGNHHHADGGHPNPDDDHNPDTDGAFDMDLE
jgi:hypothetical protein